MTEGFSKGSSSLAYRNTGATYVRTNQEPKDNSSNTESFRKNYAIPGEANPAIIEAINFIPKSKYKRQLNRMKKKNAIKM